jgi:N-methylhydantoinase A/oxoprolinase/acetone carboxylase beta subunit
VSGGIRVGVDVGGTFTKAVALEPRGGVLRARAVVPTTSAAAGGVSEGVAQALRRVLASLGGERERVELVAFSTTQAMNALLEGDVARVGVVGIGAAPDLRVARRRTRIGDIKLAPKRVLGTEHAFLDASAGLDEGAIDRSLEALRAAGCTAVAVSGAFSVDAPGNERLVGERARAVGLAACAGHELTGAYGLETRTVSAAINASILPVMQRTARTVEQVLEESGVEVPLLVLCGDGGAMGIEAFRRSPSLTVGSGPAAGVAAALHQLALRDAIVLECGGTSSNVSVVKAGGTALRTLRVMGRPTSIRSVDSWVVGAGGGSMARVRRRRIEEAGPRSAHIAGLPYASYADAAQLEGGRAELVSPRPVDPEQYAVIVTASGRRLALTATCAAHALGFADQAAATKQRSSLQEAAVTAFAALGRRLGRSAEDVAREHLARTVEKIARVVDEAARSHSFGADVPVVALGGAGAALVPEVARRLGRAHLVPHHPEILSSIGAAMSLVRAEVARHGGGPASARAVAREAQHACVAAGAAPATVQVETSFEAREGILRAVATGAVALESGAAGRDPVDEGAQLRAAAGALGLPEDRLGVIACNDFYRVFCENGSGGVAVVDGLGTVALADHAKRVIAGEASGLLEPLAEALHDATTNLGVATLLPRVSVVCGPQVVDLSESRRAEDLLATAREVLEDGGGSAVAVIR